MQIPEATTSYYADARVSQESPDDTIRGALHFGSSEASTGREFLIRIGPDRGGPRTFQGRLRGPRHDPAARTGVEGTLPTADTSDDLMFDMEM